MAAPWEYRMLTYQLRMKGFDYSQIESDLNGLGKEGWEAVGSIAPSYGQGQAVELAVMVKRAV